MAHGLVEPQSTAVEENLVDVRASYTAVYSSDTLIANNDAYAVDRSSVEVRLVALGLQLSLQLHATQPLARISIECREDEAQLPNLDRLEGMSSGNGTTCGNATGEEGAGEAVRGGASRDVKVERIGDYPPECGRHGPELSREKPSSN